MKVKKLVATVAGVLALTTVFALSACGDGESNNTNGGGGKNTTYVMEAEYIDLTDVSGAGVSSGQSGVDMIYGNADKLEENKSKGWSNGYYVAYMHVADCKLTFNFNSDKETTGTITVRLGSELGNVTITPNDVVISLNGTPIQYGSLSVNGTNFDLENIPFKDYTVSSKATIKQGANVLEIKVLENTLRGGTATGGPAVDCVKITTNATLTYEENKDNPSNRGSI